jgi:hypothetical protein
MVGIGPSSMTLTSAARCAGRPVIDGSQRWEPASLRTILCLAGRIA